MADFWEEDLTAEQEEKLLERVAGQIERRRMTTAAIMALEMHKPLSHVAANATVVFAPFLVPFLGYDMVHDASRFMQKPANIEKLICRLEEGPSPLPQTVSGVA